MTALPLSPRHRDTATPAGGVRVADNVASKILHLEDIRPGRNTRHMAGTTIRDDAYIYIMMKDDDFFSTINGFMIIFS